MAGLSHLPYRRNVGIMLANADNLVFMAQRLDNPGPALQMPQGGIDPGESPQDAAFRELHEETGVSRDLVRLEAQTDDWIAYDLPPDLQPQIWGGKFRGQEQMWFLMRFLGRDAQIDIATAEPEFSTWQWMPLEEVAQRIVPFKRAVYDQVVAAFRPYLS